MGEDRDKIIANEKIVPYQVFQAHCDERRFIYAGKPGNFNVLCRLNDSKCNIKCCQIWNSKRVAEVPKDIMSLRDVNLALRSQGDGDGQVKNEAVHGRSGGRNKKAQEKVRPGGGEGSR